MINFDDEQSQAYFAKIRRVKKINLSVLCVSVLISLTLTVIVQVIGKQDATAQALLWTAIALYCVVVAAVVFDIVFPFVYRRKLYPSICEWVAETISHTDGLIAENGAEYVLKKEESRAYLYRAGGEAFAQFDTSPFRELFIPESAARYIKEYLLAYYFKNANAESVTFSDETRKRGAKTAIVTDGKVADFDAEKSFYIKNKLVG